MPWPYIWYCNGQCLRIGIIVQISTKISFFLLSGQIRKTNHIVWTIHHKLSSVKIKQKCWRGKKLQILCERQQFIYLSPVFWYEWSYHSFFMSKIGLCVKVPQRKDFLTDLLIRKHNYICLFRGFSSFSTKNGLSAVCKLSGWGQCCPSLFLCLTCKFPVLTQ